VVRVQDTELMGGSDLAVLARAAEEGRIVLTHDVATLIGAAYKRIASAERVAGVIAVPQIIRAGIAIEDLVLIAECSTPHDFADRVTYLPLR
jgi:hypothetical protein